MHINRFFTPLVLLGGLLHSSSYSSALAQQENAVDVSRVKLAVEKLDQLAQKEVGEHAVVGMAVAVVYNDKVILARGYGPREIGREAQIDTDTVFQLASVSKPIGATVVAALVGEGKISWDSKISDLDPGFQMYEDYVTREITIRDLYAHRSGLPEHAGDLLEDMGYDRAQVLYRLRFQKPASSFRSKYAYTNFGLTEGAVAAAKANGLSWEDASDAMLYKPLGMKSTSSRYCDYINRSNKAPAHVLDRGEWLQKYNREPDAQSPAGGVSTSVNDIAQWMRLRLANGKFDGKQVISEKPLLETQQPQMLVRFSPLSGLPAFYGLGMNIGYDEQGRLRLGHSGGFCMGNATSIALVPAEHIGVAVLTNSYPVGVAEALTASFTDYALYGKLTQDWQALFKKIFADPETLGLNTSANYAKGPNPPSPALINTAYLGNYNNDLYGEVAVSLKGGRLLLEEGPKLMSFPLQHYNHDTFTYLPPGENSPGRSGVTFSIGADGKAVSVCIENLNQQGQGVFQRKKD